MRSLCVVLGLVLAIPVMAQDVPSNVVMLDISKVKWEKSPTGSEVAKIKFDESKLIALKPGSVYTEPAGVPHFVVIKEEGAIVQITGTGPTRLIPVAQ